MPWNWQQPDWPHFTYDATRLRKAETQFLLGAGKLAGILKHSSATDQEHLTIEAFTTEAVTTSQIEGETLDRASVQSSIRRQFGLATEKRRTTPAEEGISEVMVDLYRSYAKPLTQSMLHSWRRMMFQHRPSLHDIGRYRSGDDAMEIISGAIHAPKIHFEAPPVKSLAKEMARFVKWFSRTAPTGSDPLPAVMRAGIAHLYFESIHPFEDGNGRIGRCLAEKALAQTLGQPTLTALAATILARRKQYYAALEAANKSNEITDWLAWFAAVVIEAQQRTMAQVEFLLEKTRLLDRLRGQLNPRQEKALQRMLREGPEGFQGGLSAGNYLAITGASPATATRDLADLVDKGALTRTGERRHARYHVAIPIRNVSPVAIDERGNFA
jgi:Fic family protein